MSFFTFYFQQYLFFFYFDLKPSIKEYSEYIELNVCVCVFNLRL